jgi:hypothetical protein
MLKWSKRRSISTAIAAVMILPGGPAGWCQTPDASYSVQRVVGLEYPWFARMAALQGNVRLVARIMSDGTVGAIDVSSGPEPLATPAKNALNKWRFSPCPSQARGCQIEVLFSFILSGTCAVGSQCPTEFQVDLPDRVQVKSGSLTGSYLSRSTIQPCRKSISSSR